MPHYASALIVPTPSAKPESPNSNPAQLAPEFRLTFWPELTRTGPADIVVQFDYERDGSDVKPAKNFEVDKIVIHGAKNLRTESPLDFAILKLKSRVINGKETHAGDLFPPAKLATAEKLPRRNAPVYVIGHPDGNPRTVHDNAFVLFPFQADDDQFSELELAVRGEFDQEMKPLQGIERTAVEERRDAALKQLGENYLPVEKEKGFPLRELYSVRALRVPAIAANCDTYAGNSGSGVWDRRNNVLIGILFRGERKRVDQEGQEVAIQSGWRRHELILPISEVLRQLDEKLPPDWRMVHGVEIGK